MFVPFLLIQVKVSIFKHWPLPWIKYYIWQSSLKQYFFHKHKYPQAHLCTLKPTRITPRLQRSQAWSYPELWKSSGAAYCRVKQGVCRGALPLPAGNNRANPKSITFNTESSDSSANSTFCQRRWKKEGQYVTYSLRALTINHKRFCVTTILHFGTADPIMMHRDVLKHVVHIVLEAVGLKRWLKDLI